MGLADDIKASRFGHRLLNIFHNWMLINMPIQFKEEKFPRFCKVFIDLFNEIDGYPIGEVGTDGKTIFYNN